MQKCSPFFALAKASLRPRDGPQRLPASSRERGGPILRPASRAGRRRQLPTRMMTTLPALAAASRRSRDLASVWSGSSVRASLSLPPAPGLQRNMDGIDRPAAQPHSRAAAPPEPSFGGDGRPKRRRNASAARMSLWSTGRGEVGPSCPPPAIPRICPRESGRSAIRVRRGAASATIRSATMALKTSAGRPGGEAIYPPSKRPGRSRRASGFSADQGRAPAGRGRGEVGMGVDAAPATSRRLAGRAPTDARSPSEVSEKCGGCGCDADHGLAAQRQRARHLGLVMHLDQRV